MISIRSSLFVIKTLSFSQLLLSHTGDLRVHGTTLAVTFESKASQATESPSKTAPLGYSAFANSCLGLDYGVLGASQSISSLGFGI
jgi:hypothetical protein